MKVKQTITLAIYPKIFNIINFYSKGLYCIQFALVAQDELGGKIHAFPSLDQGRDARKQQDRKAKVEISQQNKTFTTQQYNANFIGLRFYITFSSESVILNSIALFRIQLEKGKKYKLYLDTKLIITHVRLNRKKDSSSANNVNSNNKQKQKQTKKGDQQFNKKVTPVVHRKIYFNNLKWINTYRRIIFSEPEYFSYLDVYFVSIKTGDKIRPYDFQLADFCMMPIQQKAKLHLEDNAATVTGQIEFKKSLYCFSGNIASNRYSEIKALLRYSICDFYQIMICLPVKQYKKLVLVYQNFRAMSLSMNNSTIIQDIKISYLQWMGKQSENTQKYISSEEALMEYYQTQNYFQIYLEIMNQSKIVYQNVQWIFQKLLQLLLRLNSNIFQFLANLSIEEAQKLKYKKLILYGEIKESRKEAHTNFIKIRDAFGSQSLIYQDLDLKHPFIMIEGENQLKQVQPEIKKNRSRSLVNMNLLGATSLIVFVHGYQGTQADLQIARYFLELHNMNCFCLLSQAIQDDMDQTIEFLGKKLAQQIISHVDRSHNRYNKLNFIGYSLGGIIIREAMKHLQKYKAMMNLFISFASPHTGTVDGNNYLVRTGIWYLINFEKAKNIKQLHCQAESNKEISLMKLSQCQSLTWFQKFIVVSSQQDSFVPYTSSRIDQSSSSMLTKDMCNNIKKRVKKFQRVEVWFDVQHDIGTMDKVLGRRAHIQFLENRVFLDCFFRLYGNQF